jgi:outer membrane biogenesis lipoprotein LolB
VVSVFLFLAVISIILITFSFSTPKKKNSRNTKHWQHDQEMRDIEAYTGRDYFDNDDPYDY